MTKKKLFYWIGLGILLLFTNACSFEREYKFGFLMPNDNTAYYIEASQHFKQHIENKGGNIVLRSADDDEYTQIKQADELIKMGVDVIVISSINVNTAAKIVRNAKKHGVKVVAYDRLINNCDLDFFITYNSTMVGELMAKYALERNPKGKYVLFYGDAGDGNAHLVRKGMDNILKSHIESGDINIMYKGFIDDWSGDEAYHQIKIILDYSMSVPDVILSSYDGMSTGTIKALNEYDNNCKILITGQNGELEALQNIYCGKQAMTVFKPAGNLAKLAADVAWSLVKNQKLPYTISNENNGRKEVSSILLEPDFIDKNNIKAEIIEKGIYSQKELQFKSAQN